MNQNIQTADFEGTEIDRTDEVLTVYQHVLDLVSKATSLTDYAAMIALGNSHNNFKNANSDDVDLLEYVDSLSHHRVDVHQRGLQILLQLQSITGVPLSFNENREITRIGESSVNYRDIIAQQNVDISSLQEQLKTAYKHSQKMLAVLQSQQEATTEVVEPDNVDNADEDTTKDVKNNNEEADTKPADDNIIDLTEDWSSDEATDEAEDTDKSVLDDQPELSDENDNEDGSSRNALKESQDRLNETNAQLKQVSEDDSDDLFNEMDKRAALQNGTVPEAEDVTSNETPAPDSATPEIKEPASEALAADTKDSESNTSDENSSTKTVDITDTDDAEDDSQVEDVEDLIDFDDFDNGDEEDGDDLIGEPGDEQSSDPFGNKE